MKTYTASKTQEAQALPQIERFIVGGNIYVVEKMTDYESLPAAVKEMISLRDQL